MQLAGDQAARLCPQEDMSVCEAAHPLMCTGWDFQSWETSHPHLAFIFSMQLWLWGRRQEVHRAL